MNTSRAKTVSAYRAWTLKRDVARRVAGYAGFVALAGLTVWSAILTKQARFAPGFTPALANVSAVKIENPARERTVVERDGPSIAAKQGSDSASTERSAPGVKAETIERWSAYVGDDAVRWFNGRPVRPARVITMKVTGYSPDARSCGEFADGKTATLHSVETNGGQLVAADPRVLPYGSMITVPGYDAGRIVPVLDCGGAIKGKRLDLLFATHEEALKWGVKDVRVVVWEYADGKPAENPRTLR